jgi:trigger factor
MKRDIQIPGFRKGKAPDGMILRRFRATIHEETLKEMIPRVAKEIFESKGIHPVGEPTITELKFEETGPVEFDVSVEESPEIDIAGFEGMEVAKEALEVTDGDVTDSIEHYRRMKATQSEVDREVRTGDIIVVNLQKYDEAGVPIIGEKMENHSIHLDGQSSPSPDFDAQVVGMRKGDRRKVRFTYDETIENPRLVGVTETFEVEIVRVIENVIPELTDDFARNLGEYTDLEDLRAKTRERLASRNVYLSERKLRYTLMDEFIRQSPFEVPNTMVERILQVELENIRKSHPGEQVDEEAVRSRFRADAVRSVQTYLVIEAVKKKLELDVTKEELSEWFEKIAQSEGLNPKELRRTYIKDNRLDEVRDEIIQEKAYEWIKSVARIREETVSRTTRESRIIVP